jgi:hypothetical protein
MNEQMLLVVGFVFSTIHGKVFFLLVKCLLNFSHLSAPTTVRRWKQETEMEKTISEVAVYVCIISSSRSTPDYIVLDAN